MSVYKKDLEEWSVLNLTLYVLSNRKCISEIIKENLIIWIWWYHIENMLTDNEREFLSHESHDVTYEFI